MLPIGHLRPWLHILSTQGKDVVKLHKPYKNIPTRCRFPVLTVIGSIASDQIGLNTSLEFFDGKGILCNVLMLGEGQNRWSNDLRGTQQEPGIPDCPERFLRRLCVEISEVICVFAQSLIEAANELFRLVDSGEASVPGGESLPQIIVILSRDEELVKFPNSEDYNDTFSNNVINRWRSLGRNEGIYNQLLLSFIQRTRIWSSDGLDRSLFTDWQYILHYMSGLRPVRRTLTMIVSQVESLCDSIPIPRANVPRYQHWPGRSPQHRSALYHWLGVLDGSKEKTSKLATVLAHLFLQDAAQVAHSKFTYVAPRPRYII